MAEKASEAGAPPQAPLTEEQLAELEGALRAATPAPWQAFGGWVSGPDGGLDVDCDGAMSLADVAVIVALRNAAPSLIDEVRRLRALLNGGIEDALVDAGDAIWQAHGRSQYTPCYEAWVAALRRIRAMSGRGPPVEPQKRPPNP